MEFNLFGKKEKTIEGMGKNPEVQAK